MYVFVKCNIILIRLLKIMATVYFTTMYFLNAIKTIGNRIFSIAFVVTFRSISHGLTTPGVLLFFIFILSEVDKLLVFQRIRPFTTKNVTY